MSQFFNYSYFSGANTTVYVNNSALIECAGISFSYQNSRQPVYGYASDKFDVMLPGRIIIQGNLLVNYVDKQYLLNLLGERGLNNSTRSFDIKIEFGETAIKNNIVIKDCYIISRGQTVQVSDQAILEEFGFLGRELENDLGNQ
jgi:hypothetical protein